MSLERFQKWLGENGLKAAVLFLIGWSFAMGVKDLVRYVNTRKQVKTHTKMEKTDFAFDIATVAVSGFIIFVLLYKGGRGALQKMRGEA